MFVAILPMKVEVLIVSIAMPSADSSDDNDDGNDEYGSDDKFYYRGRLLVIRKCVFIREGLVLNVTVVKVCLPHFGGDSIEIFVVFRVDDVNGHRGGGLKNYFQLFRWITNLIVRVWGFFWFWIFFFRIVGFRDSSMYMFYVCMLTQLLGHRNISRI